MPRAALIRESERMVRSQRRIRRARPIPYDDEPLTTEDMRAIDEADAAFARGDYCTLDELKADLAADVAPSRPHKGPQRPSSRPRR